MANINWIGGSGSWNTGSDWSTGKVPTDLDAVTIDVPLITVSIDGTLACAAYTLTTTGSTLSVSGGTLTTVADATFGGAFVESLGLYVAGGLGATFSDGITLTGGTIEALAGAALTIKDGGTLAGALTGAGQLDIAGGDTYIQKGFSSALSAIVVSANLGFDVAFTTHNDFTVNTGGSVDLFGNKLTLAGASVIDGTVGNGILVDSGTLTLGSPNSAAFLDNGLTLDVTGTLIQSGNLNQGALDAGAKIVIFKSGQYLINSNWAINDPASSTGTIINNGTLAKTGGGKIATIGTSLTNTGVLQADTGTLLLSGLVNAVGGSVTGGGTLALSGAQTTFGNKLSLQVSCVDLQSGLLVLNKSLSYSGEWDMNGNAVLNLNTSGETLSLLGSADFNTGTITGYGGTVLIKGTAQISNPGNDFVFGGPNTLTVAGTLDQTGSITFGTFSNPVADIAQGGTWSLTDDSAIYGSFGLIDNAGTFIVANGNGNGSAAAIIAPEFESTGTLTVNAATLQFTSDTLLAGTVTGSGTLDLAGTTTLQSGLGVSIAALSLDNATAYLGENLSYAEVFSQTGNSSVLDLGGHTLSLSGAVSLDGGTLTDAGMLSASGTTTVDFYAIDNAAELVVTGHAEQIGSLSLAGGTLVVSAGGSYIFDEDGSIAGSGALDLAGTLTVDGLGGTGDSTIYAAVEQTGGALVVNNQTLTLYGGGALAGAVSGSGSLALAGGVFMLDSTLAASIATIDVGANATAGLAANVGYGGNFFDEGAVNLTAATLSLTGTTILDGASLNGPGTLLASASTTLSGVSLLAGATLNITGVAEMLGSITDTASTLMVGAGGTLSLDANQSITGGGMLDVAGQLLANSDGLGTLSVSINDTGLIAANLGTLDINGKVLGSGSFSIAGNATLAFSSNSSITAATTIGFTGSNALLDIGNPIGDNMSTFGAMLADFATGDMISINEIAAASAKGTLSASGLQYTVSDSGGDTLTLTFTSKQAQGSIFVGTLNGVTTLFHH